MPWSKSSVPKFGNWDKSEELSYSIIFDKARAEKERFLHVSDNELSSAQSSHRNSRENPGKKTLSPDEARADRERSSPTSEQVKMFTRAHQNVLKNPEAIAGRSASHAPSYNASLPHDGLSRAPLQNRATKGSTFRNERQHVDQAGRAFPETLHTRSHAHAPGRLMYAQNPPIVKMRSSQAGLEAARIADMQRKHAVPKFGDWASGDAFTADFNKARNEKNLEKSSKNASFHPSVKAGPPLQPDEDLYQSSEFPVGSAEHEKERRWLQILCCSGPAPH